ncbi:HAMP domain-containing sensor histidine kinase [uncultured Clostridium sp.]|uniref:sensor histidine kinase n=1 Tax=uncultured Clostridium sp. TaxID=59620 RepID=UPI0025F2B211|nr:sensor histidine kinase [uncultured Clostridium sp.]
MNTVEMNMKPWKRTLAIGVITALSSQLYWNVFVNNFRISTSVILLPVLIMTVGIQIHTRTICFVTACIVYVFRLVILLFQGMPLEPSLIQVLPGALFYICYGLIFKLQIKNKHIVQMERLIVAIFFCDFGSNVFEVSLQELLQQGALPALSVVKYLMMIAIIRTLFAAVALIGERQYRALLKKAEHENRYQRLFLMTTGLKNEIYLMHKNTEEIERVMSNAYRLYEKTLTMEELPKEMQQMALEIARDVHEIKKDYIRIIQGIEQEIDEDYDEEKMNFQDLLQILEASTYHMLAEKRLDVRLLYDCQENFVTKEHYILMAVLKNLVNNAIEAIETKGRSGTIRIAEKKEGDSYLFEVTDDGPGISERQLPNIFKMGYSTKFDEKTGNIYRGVGLVGVKNAVEEQFKGSIDVESSPGKGTKFRIVIPAEMLEEP